MREATGQAAEPRPHRWLVSPEGPPRKPAREPACPRLQAQLARLEGADAANEPNQLSQGRRGRGQGTYERARAARPGEHAGRRSYRRDGAGKFGHFF